MAEHANILVVSDLHFGEELLPGAGVERRSAVELGAHAFRDFLRYHAVRRLGGRPWRLVIAGDLFDFMSVVIPGLPELPARNADERRLGLGRGTKAGVRRLDAICDHHRPLLEELVKFAAAGHSIDVIVGNHDVELLEPEVMAAFEARLRRAGTEIERGGLAQTLEPEMERGGFTPTRGVVERAMSRIQIVRWFVYVPGVAWVEHGHVYDEGCSFEFNLAPTDPKDDRLVFNADYAAIRYLGMASPDLDPHGIEEWSFGGFLHYAWGQGFGPFWRLLVAYVRFSWALLGAGAMHRSLKRRAARSRIHRERVAHEATAGGITLDTAAAIDRLARAPLTVSWRRLGRLLVLDKWGLIAGTLSIIFALVLFAPLVWALAGTAVALTGAVAIHRGIGQHLVTSQLPMRAIPNRLRKLLGDVPVIVFGHTHDPRWQPLRGGGLYINSGTWLPALRPGLRRSFTHVLIQPRVQGDPLVELRQWRDGTTVPFDASADLGAGVTNPGFARAG